MALTQHPLSAAFPAMSDADFLALRDDIEDNGQREPVIIFEGMVLDGWHRYRACTELGIEPTKFTFGGSDPVAFVLSQNLHRRHLSASQRAAAVVSCREWAPAHRPGKKGDSAEAGNIAPFSKNADLAKLAQVGERTIKDAKAAHAAGLTEAVKDGAISVSEAASIARGEPLIKAGRAQGKPKKVPAKKWIQAEVKAADAGRELESTQHQLEDANTAVRELADEVENLQAKLAVQQMDATAEEKAEAARTIADLRAQVRTLTAELDAMRVSRDTYQAENAEMMKQIASLRRQLQKVAS